MSQLFRVSSYTRQSLFYLQLMFAFENKKAGRGSRLCQLKRKRMNNKKINILAISGSLRPDSSATAVLKILANLFPGEVDFEIFQGIAGIPAFDDSKTFPLAVNDFIRQIKKADAVVFCIPEYAFGVPGALKNALDWTVSTTVFSDKPVALITAASSGEKAHAAMRLTLTALGTRISEETQLLIPYVRTILNERGEINNLATLSSMKQVVQSVLQKIPLSHCAKITY